MHPLIEREAEIKKEEHVPRHIELTAVPMQIGTNRIRVIESYRFEKRPIETESHNNS